MEKSFNSQSILVALYLQSTKVSLGLGWFYKTDKNLDLTKSFIKTLNDKLSLKIIEARQSIVERCKFRTSIEWGLLLR